MPLTQPCFSSSEVRLNSMASHRHRGTSLKQTDDDELQYLAMQARSYSRTVGLQQQAAIARLLDALRLSGRLRGRGHYSVEVYEDAVNRTLCWVAFHLDQFDPDRGSFPAWVNYRLDILLREAYAETLDPLVRAQKQQLIRRKYQLTAMVSQVGKIGLGFWLALQVKGIAINGQGFVWLAVLCRLSGLRKANRVLGDRVFLDLARATLSVSPLQQVSGESVVFENLAQPEEQLCLSELIAEYIESDPELLSRHHVHNCPKATLKAILRARLEARSWQEIADSFSLTVAVVKNFFLRQMKTVAPLIGQEILSYL
ncbi:MAG: hypothetical protein GPJ24_22315 [Microcystis aeruginosa SX13-11]|nr:hypothetical protein [Microcystis aeruginosa SX13-11]